jgi:hypothetical protein
MRNTPPETTVLDCIPGADAIARACQAARGSTITYILDAIAWAYTAHQKGGWTDQDYRCNRDSVRDYAAFLYEGYDGYPADAHFDDLRPEHHEPSVSSVLACFNASFSTRHPGHSPSPEEMPAINLRPVELTPEQWASSVGRSPRVGWLRWCGARSVKAGRR